MSMQPIKRIVGFAALCAAMWCHSLANAQASGTIQPGQVLFWRMERQPAFASALGARAAFAGHEAVYASAVPIGGMQSIEGQTAFVVAISVDGQRRAEVGVSLRAPEKYDRALPFPVLPYRHDDALPTLSAAILASLQGLVGSHEVLLELYLARNRTYVAGGAFSIDARAARMR